MDEELRPVSNGYWLRAQVAHDTGVAEEALADQIECIEPWSESAV
jgi:antitoxin HigA-1